MTTPEPVDEQPVAPAETRGGDRLSDITVPEFPVAEDIDPFAED